MIDQCHVCDGAGEFWRVPLNLDKMNECIQSVAGGYVVVLVGINDGGVQSQLHQ